jgi:N-(2-amino-2-carboxyethyl)-L-glutamate synthase
MTIDVQDGAVRRARIASSIIDLVGTTPLVHLSRFSAAVGQRVYAKLEYLNPGGSIKDRPAKRIIQAGIDSGRINSDTVVIESSSGNLGIALAQFCRYLGLRFVCVVDPNACEAKVSKIRTLGGEIRRVDQPDPTTHEFLPARIALVQRLIRAEPNSFWPNQYANLDNAGSHHETVQEILSALDGALDYLFVATSSCGTLRGCADYLREHDHTTKIIAVDAKGSHIFGAASGLKRIPGFGAGLRPALFDECAAHEAVKISDTASIHGCHRMLDEEALFIGGSSGAIVSAIEQMSSRIPAGASCVAVFPDSGDHYLDTIYNDDWVNRNFPTKSEWVV